ncbi:MAG: AAA family ATPase [Bryobacteraceae bacterium]
MISRVEALRYRVLRNVSQDVQPFQVLAGPNASGKSTFLDTIAFFGDLLRAGACKAVLGELHAGVPPRAANLAQLLWMGQGTSFELAAELAIPAARQHSLTSGASPTCRYEIAVGWRGESGDFGLLSESLWLLPKPSSRVNMMQVGLFPQSEQRSETLLLGAGGRAPATARKVVNKVVDSGNDYFFSETSGWRNLFLLGPMKSALGNLPEDEAMFPVATWTRRTLMEGVVRITLNSEALRRPSPPSETGAFLPDGSNLPWLVERLERDSPERHAAWVARLRSAIAGLRSVTSRERVEDRHRYLVLQFDNGFEAPSWSFSAGTLRLLALTLLGYIPDLDGVYLIEEPENGINPASVELLFQSLSSIPTAQILCVTHSPAILSMALPEQVLKFDRDETGAAIIK